MILQPKPDTFTKLGLTQCWDKGESEWNLYTKFLWCNEILMKCYDYVLYDLALTDVGQGWKGVGMSLTKGTYKNFRKSFYVCNLVRGEKAKQKYGINE